MAAQRLLAREDEGPGRLRGALEGDMDTATAEGKRVWNWSRGLYINHDDVDVSSAGWDCGRLGYLFTILTLDAGEYHWMTLTLMMIVMMIIVMMIVMMIVMIVMMIVMMILMMHLLRRESTGKPAVLGKLDRELAQGTRGDVDALCAQGGGLVLGALGLGPGRDEALCVDDALPRHVVGVEAGGRVRREVLHAEADLARALGF